jgi:hypothetical protein
MSLLHFAGVSFLLNITKKVATIIERHLSGETPHSLHDTAKIENCLMHGDVSFYEVSWWLCFMHKCCLSKFLILVFFAGGISPRSSKISGSNYLAKKRRRSNGTFARILSMCRQLSALLGRALRIPVAVSRLSFSSVSNFSISFL